MKFIIQLLFISVLISSCARKAYHENDSETSTPTEKQIERSPILFIDYPMQEAKAAENLENSNGIILANFKAGSFGPIFNYDHLALTYVVDRINNSSQNTFTIVGHTHSQGSEKANVGLSQKRAERVKELLVENYNLSSDVINAEGEGESYPITSNASKEGRERNSRVEIRINGK